MARLPMGRGYKPNNSMRNGLGGFMMDPRKGSAKAARSAARTVARVAKTDVLSRTFTSEEENADDEHLANNYETRPAIFELNDNGHVNPRWGALVLNQTRYAARDEFGAEPGHKGANRSLRKAGQKVGQLRGEIG